MTLKEKIKELLYKITQYIKKYFFIVLHPGTPAKAILMWIVNSIVFPILLAIFLVIILIPFSIILGNESISLIITAITEIYSFLSFLLLPIYYILKTVNQKKENAFEGKKTEKIVEEEKDTENKRAKEITQKLTQHRELLDNFAKKYCTLAQTETARKNAEKIRYGPFDTNTIKALQVNQSKFTNWSRENQNTITDRLTEIKSQEIDINFISMILKDEILNEDLTKIVYLIDGEHGSKLIELLSTKYGINLTMEELRQIIPIHYKNIKLNELEKIFKNIEKDYTKFIEHYVKYFGESATERENFIFFTTFLEEKNLLLTTTDTGQTLQMKKIAADITKYIKKQKLDVFERQLEPDTQIFSIQEIDFMTGKEFENAMNKIFSRQGYKAITTVYSNDQGADLILEKFGKKIVVQAKRYQGHVPNKAIQEVVAAKQHYKCDEAWLVTNSILTRQAKALAKSNNVKTIEREELKKML